MKPHITITVRRAQHRLELPYWADVVSRPDLRKDRFLPAVDAVFARHNLAFTATREYAPAVEEWSPQEVQSGLDRVYRLVLQTDSKIPRLLIDEIRLLPEVEDVRAGVIDDMDLKPAVAQSFAARTDRASRDAIGLDEAHAFSKGDNGVTIAILDTGVDLDHPEYRDALLPGHDFVDVLNGAEEFIGDYLGADVIPEDEVGHGTHVAGIIGGRGKGMPSGVAPRCKILPVRVLAAMSREGRLVGAGLVENINNGVKWAIDQGADVINMSLGVRHSGGGLPHKEVIDYAQRKGVTVVAASGNDGRQALYYPGAFPTVIAVGAADAQGQVADFSTFGDHVSFIAPGVDVYSTSLEDGYAFSTGTSHAAPFVAGAVALLKSFARARGNELGDRQIKHVLKHTSDKVDRRFKDAKAGFGRLNLADAVRYLDYKLDSRLDSGRFNPTRRMAHGYA
jgi:subtilisin family serine protease